MKRLILLMCSILVAGSIMSCGGGGSSDSAGGSADTAPLKYIEYMYSNENGAALNNRAAASAVYLQHGEAVRQRMNQYMNMPLLKGAGATGDPESPNWWQRYNVNADDYAEYLLSDEGRQAIENFLNGESAQPSGSIYSISKSESGEGAATIGTIGSAASAIALPFSIFHTIDSAIYNRKINNNLKKILGRLQYIENQLYDIQNQLTVIEGQLNNITDLLVQIQVQNASENLNNAKSRVNGFLAEIATLDGVDDEYREGMIKNFILNGYESMVISAYESALERTSVMNQSLATNKIPFSMLFADMVFMVEMSQLRIALAANVFTGQNLLEYRASVARNDLARVRAIRNSLNAAYNTSVNTDYLIEVASLLHSWEAILLAHIEVIYGHEDAVPVNLEEARNASLGFATFNDLDGTGAGKIGRVLRKKDAAFIVDLATYADGQSLADVFDPGTSGVFAEGKCVRIVENRKSITDPSGLNLVPIAKSFAGGIVSPPRNQCYIDPISGQFQLPRPVYWSKMESNESVTTGLIGKAGISGNGVHAYIDGFYNNGAGMYGGTIPNASENKIITHYARITPEGINNQRGSAHFIVRVNTTSNNGTEADGGAFVGFGGDYAAGISEIYFDHDIWWGHAGNFDTWGVGIVAYKELYSGNKYRFCLYNGYVVSYVDVSRNEWYSVYVPNSNQTAPLSSEYLLRRFVIQ
jgi:hypothetical protein